MKAFMYLKNKKVEKKDFGWYWVWTARYIHNRPEIHRYKDGDYFIAGLIYQKTENPPECPKDVEKRS